MGEEKLISVIIPVYNVEKYLEKCVQSVCKQTYRNLEIILVDDGSPDNCPGLCDKLAQRDSRITVVHKANGGVSSARNAGLDRARGAYVSFVDADDWIAPEMYGQLLAAVEEYQADMAICGYREVDEAGAELSMYSIPEVRCLSHVQGLAALENLGMKWDKSDQILNCCMSYCYNKLFSKELLEDLCFEESRTIGEDVLFVTQALKRCEKSVACPGAPYYYLMREESATHSMRDKKFYVGIYETAKRVAKTLEDELRLYPQLDKVVITQAMVHGFGYIRSLARMNQKAKYWEIRKELLAWLPEMKKYRSEYTSRYQNWIFLLRYVPNSFWIANKLWGYLKTYKERRKS